MSALFAATYPSRTSALIMYGAFPKFSYWVPTPEALDQLLTMIGQGWGYRRDAASFCTELD